MSLSSRDLCLAAWRSLAATPARSGLTALGVFLGAAAVSATLQVAAISRAIIANRLAAQEAPQITASARSEGRHAVSSADLELLVEQVPGLEAASGSAFFKRGAALYGDRRVDLWVEAVSSQHLQTSGRQLQAGRFFSVAERDRLQAIAVVDEYLREQLFGEQPALNQQILVAGVPYTVIGVMESKLRSADSELRGEMLVPLSYYRALSGRQTLGWFQLRLAQLADLPQTEQAVETWLAARFPDAEISTSNNVMAIRDQQRTLRLASRSLLAVGIVALAIAGVGIANITLATVWERTGEIGLRRAVGARQRDILLQFVLEAVLVGTVGATTAVVSVTGLTRLVASHFELPYQFAVRDVVLTLSAALLVGVSASALPAYQASQIAPARALRDVRR